MFCGKEALRFFQPAQEVVETVFFDYLSKKIKKNDF